MKQYEAAYLVKRAYELGDFELLFPVMTEEYEHMSFWVLKVIRGKEEAIDYYKGKGDAIKKSRNFAKGTIVEIIDGPVSVRPRGVFGNGERIKEDPAFYGREDCGKISVLLKQTVNGEEDYLLVIPTLDSDGMLKQILITDPELYKLSEFKTENTADLSEEEQIFHLLMEKYDLDEIGLTEKDMRLNARMMTIISHFVHGKLTPGELVEANDFLDDVLDGTVPKFVTHIPEGKYISTLVRGLEHLDETKGKLTMEEKVRFAFCIYHSRMVRVYDSEKDEVFNGLVDFDTVEHIEQCYQSNRKRHPDWYAFAEEETGLGEDEAPFGFSEDNPIPVVSVSDEYAYLDCLRKPGYELHFMRKGSHHGAKGIVDKWLVGAQPEGTQPSQVLPDLFEIYIYPYAVENSRRAPEGFELEC